MTSALHLPAEVRDRVLAAALASRPGGTSVAAAPAITAVEAFARAADSFLLLLAELTEEQWRTRTLRDLDVQGLAGHLIGVEHDVRRALRGDADVADADHVLSTEAGVQAQAGRTPAQTWSDLRLAIDDTIELLRTTRDDGAVLSMHGMRLSCRDLLVVRAFELWTHENDVRRVLSLPATAPDASTLALMTELAVRLLPQAARRMSAAPEKVELRLVLTGAGGGTWDVPLGPADGAGAELLMVADAVDFCRVVAARLDPDDLDVHITGARTHAGQALAAAASLALD
jgi:uncharacterized protein (TIGR03083 family)